MNAWHNEPLIVWNWELWDERKRTLVLVISAAMILAIALGDWWTMPYVSLGFLYLFPIMLLAGFLSRSAIAVLGILCAVLSEVFSSLDRSLVRLSFEALAIVGCGLFVSELIRNRRLSLEVQHRLKTLVETSPAAVVTVDDRGYVELANRAAVDLMAPAAGRLVGSPIAAFLPQLHHALHTREAPPFRASMQCLGHRGNGESFLADVWFSTYRERGASKLAAIIGDVTEDAAGTISVSSVVEGNGRPVLTDREAEVLRFLVQGLTNKEIGARMRLSESTVKNTLQQLFQKTAVRVRAQLVRVAIEQYRDIL